MFVCRNQLFRILSVLSICAVRPVFATPDAEIARGLAAYRTGAIERALEILTTAAERGNADARFSLGAIYLEDAGVRPDPSISTGWYRAAAEQGHVEAQFSLGNAYLHGRGVAVDHLEARRWWLRAGQAGSAEACLNLGVDYLQRSEHLALAELGMAWLHRSAELGNDRAATYLSLLGEPDESRSQGRDWRREPLRSEARLLVVDPRRFSLQLFSASSRESAEAYIVRHALGERALLFRLPKNKQLFWNVVYGDYESREEAERTIAAMRDELRQANPWPRALNAVQETVKTVWREQGQVASEFLP